MDTLSGRRVFLEMTVECPKYKAMCLSIPVDECKKCEHHKAVEKVTELNSVEIYDVICKFPFRRRVTRLVREAIDAGTDI